MCATSRTLHAGPVNRIVTPATVATILCVPRSPMASSAGLSGLSGLSGLTKSWRAVKTHAGVFTGGKVQLLSGAKSDNGPAEAAVRLACLLHDDVALVDAASGELQRTLQRDIEVGLFVS